METAFQTDAFQNDAFQIATGPVDKALLPLLRSPIPHAPGGRP